MKSHAQTTPARQVQPDPLRLEGADKPDRVGCEEEEEEEEESLFKADAVNEEDPERDRATQV